MATQKKAANSTLKLEKYSPGRRLKSGKYITFFGGNKSIQLLNSGLLLPGPTPASASYAGMGRQLVESFDPEYGYGTATVAGRFQFSSGNNASTTNFGWLFSKAEHYDETMEFYLYMGDFGGPLPSPVQNYAILSLQFFANSESSVVSIAVDAAEVNYEFNISGEHKLMLYIKKPAAANKVRISIKLKRADNGDDTLVWLNRVERYISLLQPPAWPDPILL